MRQSGERPAASSPKPPQFASHLWRTVGCAAALAIAFALYAGSEKKIDRANELRLRSRLLAGELRQSSHDLTRMVRTYAVTGDGAYKQHYQDILDIRDGRKARLEDLLGPGVGGCRAAPPGQPADPPVAEVDAASGVYGGRVRPTGEGQGHFR